MIFTGQLGTVDSQLGAIVLGAARYDTTAAFLRLVLAPSGGAWLTLEASASESMALAASASARITVRRA